MRLTLDDFARSARTRLTPAVRDVVEGGAGEERTSAANVESFDRVRLRLRGADRPDGRRLRDLRNDFPVSPTASSQPTRPGDIAMSAYP